MDVHIDVRVENVYVYIVIQINDRRTEFSLSQCDGWKRHLNIIVPLVCDTRM